MGSFVTIFLLKLFLSIPLVIAAKQTTNVVGCTYPILSSLALEVRLGFL